MEHTNSLEAITVMTFHDGNKRFARCYQGLLNFQEGDIINLITTSEEMPVSQGNYVIRRGNIPNQMSLALDDKSRPDSVYKSRSDSIYRYYDCKRLP